MPNTTCVLRLAVIAFAAFGPVTILSQECSDELPVAQKPKLKSCSWYDVLCKEANSEKQAHWRDLTRTFGDRVALDDGSAKETVQNAEYKVRGCRGTVVVPEVTPTTLNSMHVSILAPSGTQIYDQAFQNEGRPVRGSGLRLPETGTYTVRVSTTAASKAVDVCTKHTGSFFKGECVEHGTQYVYPVAYSIGFKGSSGASALSAGERADGTITSQQPFARRIAMDRHVDGQVTITSMGGAPVAARLVREDGGLVAQQNGTSLTLPIPSSAREAVYLLDVSVGQGSQPTALTVSVDTGTATARQLTLGQETVAEFQGLPGDLSGEASAAHRAEWTFSAHRLGTARLTVVPSGMAGLVVSVAVYNRTTEETVLNDTRVERSATLSFPVRRVGDYLVVITPLQVHAGQGTAKYTLALSQ